MADEQKKRRGAVEMGPTAATVAANVRRLRDDVRGWSTYELSGKLAKAGRPIAPSAVAKIERGERQVTVDDLVALAVALGVNASALLLPVKVEPADGVEVTGYGAVSADEAWNWADGRSPLLRTDASGLAAGRARYEAELRFKEGRPHWLEDDAEGGDG
ncbi:helix-turn-helix transcriptional regulator [Streptomyces sp. NPDC049887]|uniref:helix-turn-helix domain-containing protein n=1 Tax=Streptomyces sp. NPDC049887 TaxID=3155654 RepID=UPI00342AC230